MPPASFLALAGWALAAAAAAALGPLLLGRPGSPTPAPRRLGLASALAAGAMLGVAYPLMSIGLDRAGLVATLGALLGIGVTWGSHVLLGVGAADPLVRARRAVAVDALHSAPEGIAMGAAMAVGPRLGLFLVATLAVHNVWESEVLGSRLIAGGASRGHAAAAGVLTNVPQVALALVAFLVAGAAPASVPLLLGVGFGALIYLCLAELLPESYESVGRTSIAVVVSAAAGVVALLGGSA